MIYAPQTQMPLKKPKHVKDAPRFKRIIQKNVQMNNPDNPITKPDPLYYQITEKAEGYILNKQFAKAKEQYSLLDKEYPLLFARDMNNAVRCAILSRDFGTTFFWCEKLAAKGVGLKYFNASIFTKLKHAPGWNDFEKRFPDLEQQNIQKIDSGYINKITALTNEDQADYGLENRKTPEVIYATTERVTEKLISLFKSEGLPTEEKVGLTIKNDTLIIISPDQDILIRHAIQQEPFSLPELQKIIEADQEKLTFDFKRSSINTILFNSCYHNLQR